MADPIIDAHHHIWRYQRVPWLSGPQQPRIFGDYAPIRRDYAVDEYQADACPNGITKSVYVQVNVTPGDEVEEVTWAQSVGDRGGFPHAIVGYADLAAPELAATLDRQMTHGRLRGIRQQLHWHDNPMYRFALRPDIMNDPSWRAGMKELNAHGLLFELQVFSGQAVDAARLALDFPDMTFVLLHAGMLEDRTPEGWRRWRAGIRRLSACPNMMVKLSGLGTFDRACSAALWKPVVEETVSAFGADRCMFGSNFPIEKLWTPYGDLIATMRECLADLSTAERRAILHGTAKRVYRL